jgi:hypothetical protein
MPWVIGCDEAGYGPPLGAFTQASVAIKLPDTISAVEDTWSCFPDLFRRRKGAAKVKIGEFPLVVDDSKLVTQLSSGVQHMGALWPLLFSFPTLPTARLGHLLEWAHLPDNTFKDDPSFSPDFPLVFQVEEAHRTQAEKMFSAAGLVERQARISMCSPKVFNRMIDQTQNKSSVLEWGWQRHMRWWINHLPGTDPLVIISDRLGGKKSYGGLFQETIGQDGIVQILQEKDELCTYKVLGCKREILLLVCPKADSTYLTVAAASMLAKHLREISMEMVNQFWIEKCPELKPTAGYPEDGKRFFNQIQPILVRLGINPDSVWRKR